MSEHVLKVQPPYFDALVSGAKTFEVRKNDRAYQRGDLLVLREWSPGRCHRAHLPGNESDCPNFTGREHRAYVTFVYAGDPRFGGVEPGHVVLALSKESPR